MCARLEIRTGHLAHTPRKSYVAFRVHAGERNAVKWNGLAGSISPNQVLTHAARVARAKVSG